MIQAVLFDMDGVLIDSEEAAFDRLRNTLAHKQVDIPLRSLVGEYVGMRSGDIYENLIKRYGFDQTVDEFVREHRQISGSYYLDGELVMMPGLTGCLDFLQQQGVQMAVVSSTHSRSVLGVLNRLSLLRYFSAVVCGDHVQHPKPSPEGYQMAAAFLGAEAKDCLVVEDSPLGIGAAIRAQMRVAAFKGAAHVQDTSQADWEFCSYEELTDWLRRGEISVKVDV